MTTSHPKRDSSRDPLDAEIEAALHDVDLQSIDLPERPRSKSGERLVPGVIVDVRGEDVFVELGPRMQGIVAREEFDEEPRIGDSARFLLRGREEDDLFRLSLRAARELSQWAELEAGSDVKARVSGQNTGGLELTIGSHRAFMPASQVDLTGGGDIARFLGQTIIARVLEIDRSRDRVVLSRRAILEEEQLESRARASKELAPGSIVSGKVVRLESFGAFVDLGAGLEGLIHVSNLSRKRVEKAEDVLAVGAEVRAMVLDIKEGGRRIGLGLKQLEPDPWADLPATISADSVLNGRVVRLTEFGAFFELAPGVEGLCHVSQLGLAGGGRRRPEEAVKVGEEHAVRILSVEADRQRISLSLLDRRGARLGSEEAVDEALLRAVMDRPSGGLSTNLGRLFKRALDAPS